ncbi:hypothetical protein FRC12_005076 [Ceratobasidium sp. 428]|nr:hypothetical protein FRC12_005076 [Ceratobasidium sp. 428]
MSDDLGESSASSLKRARSMSLPTESQTHAGDESQISTFSIDEEISCGICLGVLESPYTVIPCLHTFDKECLAGWWKQNSTCPLCKIQATSGRHSFQLQAIVNHYDNKRPPRKRAKGSDENAPGDDRAELYPFGIAPPPPGANHGYMNDDDDDENENEDDDDENDEDEDEEEDEWNHFPGGRLVFPCLACQPGHPSGYICPRPIPEPTEAMKRTEKEDYFNGRREVVAPGRGQSRIRFAEGLHTLPGADLVFQADEIAEVTQACEGHVQCDACTTYVPRDWPGGAQCRVCSSVTCMLFDPQQCPRVWNAGGLNLRPFDEAGRNITIEALWNRITMRSHHFNHNRTERDRLGTFIDTNNGMNAVIVELMTSAGHAAEDVGPYYCEVCVRNIAGDNFEAWWEAKKQAGALPAAITDLPKCWYGRECRTQSHNVNHAQRFSHDCDPRPQPQAQPQPPPPPQPPQPHVDPQPQPQQPVAAMMPPPVLPVPQAQPQPQPQLPPPPPLPPHA